MEGKCSCYVKVLSSYFSNIILYGIYYYYNETGKRGPRRRGGHTSVRGEGMSQRNGKTGK